MTNAWGYGLATVAGNGTVLDAWFPAPALGAVPAGRDRNIAPSELEAMLGADPRRNVTIDFVTIEIDTDAAPVSTADVYFRLHLLSHLLMRPNTVNLDGIFSLLPTVVWTNAGPVHPEDFARLRRSLQSHGITASGVDKFPRLLDYVSPPGVRIADAARVRLGAHLAPGTTVMHEGFVNFNAGTLGASMVEGRISQGVVIGNGTDIGGGASIMGTLSGGGTQRITVGERALLGANSGIGISIGDDTVVEAGLYVTAGTKVVVIDPAAESDQRASDQPETDQRTSDQRTSNQPASDQRRVVKAAELSGLPNLLFRRNSRTGAVEVLPRSGAGIQLNAALHA